MVLHILCGNGATLQHEKVSTLINSPFDVLRTTEFVFDSHCSSRDFAPLAFTETIRCAFESRHRLPSRPTGRGCDDNSMQCRHLGSNEPEIAPIDFVLRRCNLP